MNDDDRRRLRAEVTEVAPDARISVRFHGAPSNAPSVPKRGAGYFAFRTWGRVYVTVSPRRPLTSEEYDLLLRALQPWRAGSGFATVEGPNHEWPVLEN